MTYGFVLNGTHSADMGLRVLKVDRPVLSSPRDQYVEVPGRHGNYHVPRELGDKTIEVTCALIESDRASRWDKLRKVAAWLYTAERGEICFDDEIGRFYLAKVDGMSPADESVSHAQFTVTFRCHPISYGPMQTADFAAGALTINNIGTYPTRPTFIATITTEATYLRFVFGLQSLRIAGQLAVDDLIQIDCERQTVTRNGNPAMVLLDWQNSDFFEIAPGLVTVSLATDGACTASMLWQPKWL